MAQDFDNSFGAPGSGRINVFQDGQSIHGLVRLGRNTVTNILRKLFYILYTYTFFHTYDKLKVLYAEKSYKYIHTYIHSYMLTI